MKVVAIQQPNYMPWLGYFYKIQRADVFVFLDDVQFTRQSYINRVRILAGKGPRWLTLAASYSFGQRINAVAPADANWIRSHLEILKSCYGTAPAFRSVWPEVRALYDSLPNGSLGQINETLIRRLAARFGLGPEYRRSSEMDTGDAVSDGRLAAITRAIAPRGIYLSGQGAVSYQQEETFRQADLRLCYAGFDHPTYPQDTDAFVPGLSTLDAVFHLGWEGAAALLAA